MKIKNITLTDDMQEKLKRLKSELGYPTEAMVIYVALADFYRTTFPPYTQISKKTPAEKIKQKEEEKKMQDELEEARQLDIARKLGGKITDGDILKVVRYYTYAGRKRYPQEVPLHLLTDELIESQYSPDRAMVERLQKEGKTDY